MMKIYVVRPGLVDAPVLLIKMFRKFTGIQRRENGVDAFVQDSEQYGDLEKNSNQQHLKRVNVA